MQDVMMINNVAYAVSEVPGSVFYLKSDLSDAFKDHEQVYVLPTPQLSFRFKGKWYGYFPVNQKEKKEDVELYRDLEAITIRWVNDGHRTAGTLVRELLKRIKNETTSIIQTDEPGPDPTMADSGGEG